MWFWQFLVLFDCAHTGTWLGRVWPGPIGKKLSPCKAFVLFKWDSFPRQLGQIFFCPLNLIFPFSSCFCLPFYLTIVLWSTYFFSCGPLIKLSNLKQSIWSIFHFISWDLIRDPRNSIHTYLFTVISTLHFSEPVRLRKEKENYWRVRLELTTTTVLLKQVLK